MLDRNMKICIVGLGLMGGSYARGLTELGFEVGAVDCNAESIAYALERGWIRHGVSEVTPEYIGRFDLMIFALYPHTFLEWLEQYQQYLKAGIRITDVTGVKSCVVYEVQAMLRSDLEYIAAHPMAGRERSGVQYANTEMFRDANYIVTPTEKNTAEAIAFAEELGRELGFRTITTLTPERHDEMIAFLSQLTHCIAVSLMTCRDTASLAEYSGDSFRDLTRIARINDEMWSELFLLNQPELLKQMELFESAFHELRLAVERRDREALRAAMRLSTKQREQFDKRGESK